MSAEKIFYITLFFGPRWGRSSGVPQLKGSGEASLDDGDGPWPRRGGHRLRLDELHISSADGLTFFVLVVAQERSGRFRTSVSRRKKFCFATRRQKNPDEVCKIVLSLTPARRLDGHTQHIDGIVLVSRVLQVQRVLGEEFLLRLRRAG